MIIAVTGATGQLGRLVVNGLLEERPPEDIVAIVRDAAKAADLAERGIDVRVASYDDPGALERAFAGVDRLLFISSNEVGRRIPQHTNVIDAAKAAGVGHVVYTSAPRATTSPLILAPEHKATEEHLVASGIVHTVLRNGWYTENYARMIDPARATGTVIAAAGAGRVASASRADYAAAAVAVLLGEGHAGKVYELSGDYAWSFDELATAIGEIIGSLVTYRSVDGATLIEILTSAGMDEGTAGFFAALDANIEAGLLAEAGGELSALIGRPTTPLVEGLRSAAG
jgi:NAD(P)H dehydrogenase (quinone)